MCELQVSLVSLQCLDALRIWGGFQILFSFYNVEVREKVDIEAKAGRGVFLTGSIEAKCGPSVSIKNVVC